jgi:hypothetical protein
VRGGSKRPEVSQVSSPLQLLRIHLLRTSAKKDKKQGPEFRPSSAEMSRSSRWLG